MADPTRLNLPNLPPPRAVGGRPSPRQSSGQQPAADDAASPGVDSAPAVLVVEDDRDVRELVQRVLASHGYRADGAASGAQALAALQAGLHDLLITDLSMPDMSGWELVRLARDRDRALGIIVLSGWSQVQGELGQHRALIDCAIDKPFVVADLLHAAAATLAAVRRRR